MSAALGLPLPSKDTVMEALGDALGCPDAATSKLLGAAAMETSHAPHLVKLPRLRSCFRGDIDQPSGVAARLRPVPGVAADVAAQVKQPDP
ncbi:MAG: hypothetical protein M3P23_17000 [Actinomycetota bacterium]|nr:hypothetical protein [Actinomycetota bacterium]